MKRILPVIVLSQFFCTSLWFAGNAVMTDIIKHFGLAPGFLADLTSAVQFGFIAGTLVFAVFAISDRFSPSRVFCACAIIAAILNLGICIEDIPVTGLLLFRFFYRILSGRDLSCGYEDRFRLLSERTWQIIGFFSWCTGAGHFFPAFIKKFAH